MVQPIKQPRGARPTDQRLRQTLMATTLLASLAGTFHATAHAAPATAPNASVSTRQVNVAVPAQDLDQALTQFADQADLHLLFTSAEVAGLHSPALDGQMSIEQALQTLLAGSGLNWQFSDARTVIVRKPDTAAKGLQLKALEVSVGARTSTAISEIPGTVWVVDQVQLQEQLDTGVTLKEAIGKLVPGLDLAPEGRSNYGQNMRGRNVLVMIDGVSQNSSRGLSRQFDSISPFNVERVEVLSGASALYGGGATGGIINIVTKKGAPGPAQFETEVSGTSGFNKSDDLSSRISQSVSGGTDRVHGRLGISGEQNKAFYDGKGDQIFIDNTQTDLQYNRTLDLMGSLAIKLDDVQDLDLLAQYYDSGNNGNTGLYFPNLHDKAPSNLEDAEIRSGYHTDLEPRSKRLLFNANYHHSDLLGQDFYLQGSYRKEDNNFFPFPYYNAGKPQGVNGVYFAASQQNFEVTSLKALFAKQWDSVKLTYGVDLDRERFNATQSVFNSAISSESGGLDLDTQSKAPRYPSYRVDGHSVYAQADWKLTDALTLSGGARRQQMDVDVGVFKGIPGGSNDYAVNLFNLGAIYDFKNGHQTWINYSEGFDLPDPAKYYGKAGLSVKDNPLAGIKSRQVETGWRFADVDWDAQAAVYYIWSDKVITTDSATLTIDVADKKSRDFGFEGALTRHFNNGWDAGGTLHLVRSEEEDADGDWMKRDARYASLSKSTAFVGWHGDGRNVRLQGNHAFTLKDDSDHKISGYTTFDLMGSQETAFGTFSAGIQNLLDKEYSTVWGQRAALFYSPTYGPEYLYDYQGRGRTYTLTWSMAY
ncbi:TonB-dependent receptor [Pseudomonas helleri]|jgi:iron complex outermembrane receptor protein|uniref:TonB-dependent siderophore receptor n=1 Tax=Pseudomonas helleri TaxID=1608996 RepID=A0A6A7ZFQ2_9PSED|nr:TonB-dependent receptor [Pseudomonas helleri]MQT37321.1 TonB-dependent siderophore receptor [Pseudomonas helleri]MQU23756.1 TonB-dependent siderophore receptor [Pseudomonas helleri]MQU45277.1 TonB-dependent siderophore receptor [Pseudomonas helleri]MQU61184.1 TonB-dependent siderophore receptor [Pseudomonas helleri]